MKYAFYDYTDSNENPQKDLCVNFVLDNPLPTNISYNISGISLIIKENVGELTVNVLNGTYKYFYSNYKDYYYLTTEAVPDTDGPHDPRFLLTCKHRTERDQGRTSASGS